MEKRKRKQKSSKITSQSKTTAEREKILHGCRSGQKKNSAWLSFSPKNPAPEKAKNPHVLCNIE